MSKIFVISDTWFNRSMGDEECTSIDRNESMIQLWNETVSYDDIVYVLGGFGISDLYNIVIRLNGEIHFLNDYEDEFILDLKSDIEKSILTGIKERIVFEEREIVILKDQDCILSYYPLMCWKGYDTGTYCFHGINDFMDLKNHNISCYAKKWENKPLEIAKIKEKLEEFDDCI